MLQDRDGVQEGLVLLTTLLRCSLYDVIERVAVKLPQLGVFRSDDCGCSRRIVEESELAKRFAWQVRLQELDFARWQLLRTVKLSLFDDEQHFAGVVLPDDTLTFSEVFFLHRVDDN